MDSGGTSTAAPMVTGTIALLMSYNPDLYFNLFNSNKQIPNNTAIMRIKNAILNSTTYSYYMDINNHTKAITETNEDGKKNTYYIDNTGEKICPVASKGYLNAYGAMKEVSREIELDLDSSIDTTNLKIKVIADNGESTNSEYISSYTLNYEEDLDEAASGNKVFYVPDLNEDGSANYEITIFDDRNTPDTSDDIIYSYVDNITSHYQINDTAYPCITTVQNYGTEVVNISLTKNANIININSEYKIELKTTDSIYTPASKIDNDYTFILPLNSGIISADIYDTNNSLIYTIPDITYTATDEYITSENDLPYLLNTTKETNEYIINLEPCLKYTINKKSINNINYDFELGKNIVLTDTSLSITPTYLPANQYEIVSDGNTTEIYAKVLPISTNADIQKYQYVLRVVDENNKIIYNNIPLDELNTYNSKFNYLTTDIHKTPVQMDVTPNENGAVINLSDYLIGDVSLDNQITQTDADLILMHTVNKYNIIQTGATGDSATSEHGFILGNDTCNNITINGDISANSNVLVNAFNGNINGTLTAPLIETIGNINANKVTTLDRIMPDDLFTDEQMNRLFFQNVSTEYADAVYNNSIYISENNYETINVNLNNPLIAESIYLGKEHTDENTDNRTYNITINNNIKAINNIYIDGSVQNDVKCVIYSENGDITLNSDNFSYSGLIYAPNGTVKISGNNINITGTIIAKEVQITGSTINFNTNNSILNYTHISDEFADLANVFLTELQLYIADVNDDDNITSYDSKCVTDIIANNN